MQYQFHSALVVRQVVPAVLNLGKFPSNWFPNVQGLEVIKAGCPFDGVNSGIKAGYQLYGSNTSVKAGYQIY